MVMVERGSPDTDLGRCRYERAGGFSCAPWRVAETVVTWAIPLLSEYPAVGADDGHDRVLVARRSPGPLPLRACWRYQLCSLAGRRETVLVRPDPLNRSRVSVSVATADGSLWSGFQVRATAAVGRTVALRAMGRVITNCSVDTCGNPTAMCRVSPGPELVEVKDAP